MIHIINFPEGSGDQYQVIKYPGGEHQVRFNEAQQAAIKEASTVIVIARITDGEVMQLALLSDALARVHPNCDKTLVLPYLPYGRADRAFVKGDCFALEVFLDMIGSMFYTRIITLDVHSDVAQKIAWLRTNSFINVSPRPFIDLIVELNEHVAILLPDKGAVRYGTNSIFQCEKTRDPATGVLSGFFKVPPVGLFEGAKSILIIDDICDGGGTFVGIASSLRASGNTLPIDLYVTHGIFSRGVEGLFKYFRKIYTTDSYFGSRSPYSMDERLIITPCAGAILAELLGPADLWKNAATVQKGTV